MGVPSRPHWTALLLLDVLHIFFFWKWITRDNLCQVSMREQTNKLALLIHIGQLSTYTLFSLSPLSKSHLNDRQVKKDKEDYGEHRRSSAGQAFSWVSGRRMMGRITLRDKHWQKRYQLRYPREDHNRTGGLEGLWTQGWGMKMTNQMPMK